jgi:hypothetical protein
MFVKSLQKGLPEALIEAKCGGLIHKKGVLAQFMERYTA